MLPIFQQVKSLRDVDQICSLEFGSMPIHIHCKDLSGAYIGSNDKVHQDIGVDRKEDFLGRTDFDVDCITEGEAASFTVIDRHIIKTGKTEFFTQSVTFRNQKKYLAMNHKMPLRGITDKVIGVISFGTFVEQPEASYYDPAYPVLNTLFAANIKILQTLTHRQIACLYHMMIGLSNKEIAKKLHLSHRTIEHYIEAIKLKWGCQTRSDLISYFYCRR